MTDLSTDEFDFDLPTALIAQVPLAARSLSRMMVLSRATADIEHGQFQHFLDYVQPNDCLVFNDTRVFPARLFGKKHSGGKVECLIERIIGEQRALAHLKASKAPKPGTEIVFEDCYHCMVRGRQGDLFELEFALTEPLLDMLERSGRLPLPPYITRDPSKQDYSRYQTVFADRVGAVAAPTAGLHFDEKMLELIKKKGIATTSVTLHVGAGTFQPVRVDNVSEHTMHSEWIEVSDSACEVIRATKARQGRVIAVGTTVLRALESASLAGQCQAFSGETDIFIYPGFKFHCVDSLLTNFHLPRSTLLMLVSAFAGQAFMFDAYRQAVQESYRFFSYGDCMLIT